MLKQEIIAEDFDGNKYVEIAYFHYSKAEILEQEVTFPGGLRNHLIEIMRSGDNGAIYTFFKQFLLGAYGRKSEDGRRFIKTPEATKDFEESAAFETFLFQLLENQSQLETFFNEMMPKGTTGDLTDAQRKVLDGGLLTEEATKTLLGE